jgi:phenylpyruvate tautomerase PptA (4-oxalocrotonate tautomerase family)
MWTTVVIISEIETVNWGISGKTVIVKDKKDNETKFKYLIRVLLP